jgi:hypothetical protein
MNNRVVTLRNPLTTALSKSSVKVYTYDKDEFGVDQKISDVVMEPALAAGKLTLNSISSSIRTIYKPTVLTINVKIQNTFDTNVADNKVIVQLPEYLYYPSTQGSAYTPTCHINT